MLVDNHDRAFFYVRLSITDVCNFKCNYCLPNGYRKTKAHNFLSVPEIARLSRGLAAAGVRKIRITGGEPALRKDLTKIIATVANTPGIEEVALTTNGFNLLQHVDAWYAAGLTQLNVSIDSLDPNQFALITGSNKHQAILEGIDRALALRLPTKVNTVLLKQYNLHQWYQFLAWVKHTPISLRFIELMQTGDNAAFFADNHVRGEQFLQHLQKRGWEQTKRSATAGPAQELAHADYQGKIGFIMPYSDDFCASCNRLRITARGALHACLFAEEGHSLRHLLQHDDDSQHLQAWLQQQLQHKTATHGLHQANPGSTEHLAMLGG
jgi:cyclic pyranopterin phosphate synthase